MLIFAVFAKNYQGSYFGNSIDKALNLRDDKNGIAPRWL
jgi:hypothetical protein